MKLLANENFPLASVIVLRQAGFEVITITELSRGISDREVLELAYNEGAKSQSKNETSPF